MPSHSQSHSEDPSSASSKFVIGDDRTTATTSSNDSSRMAVMSISTDQQQRHEHDNDPNDPDDEDRQWRRRSSTIRYQPATHQRNSQHANLTAAAAAATSSSSPFGRPTNNNHNNNNTASPKRSSFIVEFAKTDGPPQIAGLMMLVAIGLGCTIGVVPAVMTDRFATLNHGLDFHNINNNATSCSDYTSPQDIQLKPIECLLGSADAQTAVSTSNLISNVLTFVTSSLMGSLSDEYGRRGILIFGLVLGSIPPLMLVLIQVIPTMSPWWYYGTYAATGVVNWIAVALSSLADVLPSQLRAPGIGLLLAGFMLGFSLSPILSMMLSKQHLSIVSFTTVLIGVVASILFLPETLPEHVAEEARKRRREATHTELERINNTSYNDDDDDDTIHVTYPYEEIPGGGDRGNRRQDRRWRQQQQQQHRRSFQKFHRQIRKYCILTKQILTRPLRELAILNRNRFFRLISLLAFFSGMVTSGDQVLLVYYLEERLGFTNGDVSLMFFIMGTMGVVAQGFLLKPINDLLGEKMVVALAFCCGAIDNTMYGLARNKQTIFAAVGVAGLTGMAFPTISAIKANNVAESEQGRIQGALYSLQALASGLGPVALRYVYSRTKDTTVGPGAMFLFAACLYLVAVCFACALPSNKANASRQPQGGGGGDSMVSDFDTTEGNGGQYTQLLSESSSSDEEDYGTNEL